MKKRKARKIKGEGWDVFVNWGGEHDGLRTIQRTDDPDAAYGDTLHILTPAFKNDAEAIRHVIARAKRGDVEAIDALWTCHQDWLIHEILWKG